MQLACRDDMVADCINKRGQQLAGGTDPSSQRRAVEINALSNIDLRLAIERLMIRLLRDEHVGEQTSSCEAAINRPRGRRCLYDAVASSSASGARAQYLEA